jgi:hypothetical protein
MPAKYTKLFELGQLGDMNFGYILEVNKYHRNNFGENQKYKTYLIGFEKASSDLRGFLHKLLFRMRYENPAITYQIEDRFKRFIIEIL